MKKTLNKIASTLLIVSISTTLAFAQKYSGYKTLEQQHQIETLAKKDLLPEPLDQGVSQNISNTITVENTKVYEGFRGIKQSNKRDNLPNDDTGDAIRIINALDNMSFSERQGSLAKLEQAMMKMSYEELKGVYLYTGSSIVEQALYGAWLSMDRSSTASFARHTASESEPNNTASTADALNDTNTAYLTAYDEDWFTFTTTSADIVLETSAGSGSDNVGDTKLYLYAADNTTDYIAYDDDGGTGLYSKITHRSEVLAPTPTDLFFSEYSEGSGNNKYLEIYNGTGADVDLSNYLIMQNGNGGPWDEYVDQLGGTLEDGDVYVIANGSSDDSILAEADITNTGICYFNGDDARALIKVVGTDTTILDYIGTFPDDPGSGWDVAGTSNATKDHTLVRKTSVVSGNTSWASSAGTDATDSEWIVYEQNTWTDVGSHTVPNPNQYYVKVVGYSNTTAGAYALTYDNTPFSGHHNNIVINEIHYNPATSQGSDNDYEFLELYNTTAADIDLNGMTVGEAGSTSNIASLDGVTIVAGSYVVVAYTGATYSTLTVPVVDNDGYFGLSNSGKTLELIDSTGALVNTVAYDDNYPSTNPWNHTDADGDDADGDGPSLELKDPALDNSLASSWKASGVDGGTPGAANSMEADILLVNTSVSSFQAVGSTQTAALQVKNLGHADLNIDSVAVSQFIPGSEVFSAAGGITVTGSTPQSTTIEVSGASVIADSVKLSMTFTIDGYPSEAGGQFTSPAMTTVDLGSVLTNVSSYSTTNLVFDLTEFNGEDPNGTWTVELSDPGWGDGGESAAGITLEIDPQPGSTVNPSWLTVTAPTAIAAGDSSDIGLSFDASSFTADYDGTADLKIYNNDPRDTLKTATASISVRADTAILSYSITNWQMEPLMVGDTSTSVGVNIANLGPQSLVVDSVRFSSGASSQYLTDLADSSVVAPLASPSFSVWHAPTVVGTDIDTMVFHANTDSSSDNTVSFNGYGYGANDTLYSFPSGSAENDGWILGGGTYGGPYNGSGYLYTVDGAAISPRSLFTAGSKVHLTFRNLNTGPQDVFIYYSDDATATQWTGWTAIDTVTLAAATTLGTSTYSRFEVEMPTTADTGYVAINFGISLSYHYTYLDDAVLAKPVIEEDEEVDSEIPEGYELEDFEDWPGLYSSDWTGSGGWYQQSSGGAVNNGKWVRENTYSSQQDSMVTTPVGPIQLGDSVTFYFKAINYYGGDGIEFFGEDRMAVYVKKQNGSERTLLWSATPANHTPSTEWAYVNAGFPPEYYGDFGVLVFESHADASSSSDWYASFDEILYPNIPVPVISLSTNELDFNAMATGGQSRTAVVTIMNTGEDTLTGAMSINPLAVGFSLSADTLTLAPDSLLAVSVTFQTDTLVGPMEAELTVSSNGGTDKTVDLMAHVIRADFVHDFEYGDDPESLGYVKHNISGGIYWQEVIVGGSNMLRVASHTYGGNTLLTLPMVTIDTDGERLVFDAKVSTASPSKASTLYVLSLSGNGYGAWSTADTLGKFSIGDPTGTGDFDTNWGTYFDDYYGISLGDSYIGLLVEDESTSFGGAATLYIDNIHFVDAPTVPIVELGSFEQHISMLSEPFSFSNYALGANIGGDTLFISSISSTGSNMVITTVSDTVVKGDEILVNFSVASAHLSMGRYMANIELNHNDTIFTAGGKSEYIINTDFTHEAITFESGSWPDALLALDEDEDGMTWQVGMSDDMEGNWAAYSNKSPENPISENMLVTFLRHIAPGDKFIFDALYTSSDPDFMHVMISSDWGGDWTMLEDVPMSENEEMGHYEFDLSGYEGMNVRLAIVDVNYGNSSYDRLYVDRMLLPAASNMTSITDARTMASDSTYAHAGDTVMVTGVVTVSDQFGSAVVFQDSSAGITAISPGMAEDAEIGDRVIVEGKLINYRSLLELSPVLNYIIIEKGVNVQPQKVTVGDIKDGISAEALESMLVVVENVTWVDTADWGGGGPGFNIDIAQGGDTAKVRIDRDTELYGTTLPYGSVDITGVIQQHDYQSDPYEGFLFMPRINDDIELMAQFNGTVTDALTGTAVSGVTVETDIDSTGTDALGHYVVNASLDAERIDFSKENYTDAFFAVDASDAGFPVLDVSLSSSPEMNVYYNGLETVTEWGTVDTSVAEGTQWAVVESILFDSSFYSSDTTIYPYAGNYMLAVTDSLYEDNSYSWWTAPRQIDLSLYNQATVRIHAWADAESCCDEVSVMIKSASDSTGDWTLLGEITGHTNGWEEFSFSLDFLDMGLSIDMELALLFESDGWTEYQGIAVDHIWVDGRSMFSAMPPVNLMAESYGDSEVPISWGAPGTETAMVQMQVINPNNWIDAQAIVDEIIANDPSQSSLTVEQWLANIRMTDPKFNLHPQPKTVIMPYVANVSASRSLMHYNVFKITEDDGWHLYDSTTSTTYTDADVTNFIVYEYSVSAVYNEGESLESESVSARPGPVDQYPIPIMVDFNVPEGTLPEEWYNESVGEGNEWSVEAVETVHEDYYFEVPGNGLFAVIDARNDSGNTSEATLVSSHFTMIEPLPAVYLKFEHYTGNSTGPIRTVGIRQAYGPWTPIGGVPAATDDWTEVVFDITEHVVGHNFIQIGFTYNENTSWDNYSGWAIDNVRIGIEPGPNNLIALPGGAGEIHLHWGIDLSPEQDPGGRPVDFDENDRPIYLDAPQCEDCEALNTRVPSVLFGANFNSGEPAQFVEYDALLDTTTELGDGNPSNWETTYTDANGTGSFDAGDPGWIQFNWFPTQAPVDQWIISDVFDAGGDSMFLMFDEYLDDYTGGGDTVAAHISSDGGATWTTVWEMADSSVNPFGGPEGMWNRHVYALGVGTAQMKVAFSFRGATSFNVDYWHLDNVYIYDEIPEDHYNVFNVFRDGEMIAEAVEQTMFMDSNVAFGNIYCYQIQPVNVSFPEGNSTYQGLSNTACSTPCNVPPPPAMLSTPADSAMIALVQDADGNIVDTEGNASLEFSWAQPDDHDGHELANAFMLQDELQSLSAMLEIPQGATSAGIPYAELVAVMTSDGQDEITGSWGIWTADSIDNACCWAQAMSTMNQLTVNITQALKVDDEFIPDVFALHQNYPNPFNPITNIVYDIPEASDVRITIYNITGQNVRTLAQGKHEPGRYRIQWNATNDYGNPLSSGMYIYRIHAGDFVSVKKLILMK